MPGNDTSAVIDVTRTRPEGESLTWIVSVLYFLGFGEALPTEHFQWKWYTSACLCLEHSDPSRSVLFFKPSAYQNLYICDKDSTMTSESVDSEGAPCRLIRRSEWKFWLTDKKVEVLWRETNENIRNRRHGCHASVFPSLGVEYWLCVMRIHVEGYRPLCAVNAAVANIPGSAGVTGSRFISEHEVNQITNRTAYARRQADTHMGDPRSERQKGTFSGRHFSSMPEGISAFSLGMSSQHWIPGLFSMAMEIIIHKKSRPHLSVLWW